MVWNGVKIGPITLLAPCPPPWNGEEIGQNTCWFHDPPLVRGGWGGNIFAKSHFLPEMVWNGEKLVKSLFVKDQGSISRTIPGQFVLVFHQLCYLLPSVYSPLVYDQSISSKASNILVIPCYKRPSRKSNHTQNFFLRQRDKIIPDESLCMRCRYFDIISYLFFPAPF